MQFWPKLCHRHCENDAENGSIIRTEFVLFFPLSHTYYHWDKSFENDMSTMYHTLCARELYDGDDNEPFYDDKISSCFGKVTMLIYRKYIAMKNVEHTIIFSFLWTFMQVWKRFTQFEQTFGDLASILKA